MFNFKFITAALNQVWSFITAVIVLITTLIGGNNITSSPNVELVKTDRYVIDSAILMNQGITTDGEYYYTSGSFGSVSYAGLAKWRLDGTRVDCTYNALPKELKEKYGSNHLGGLSYFDGKIYAAIEDDADENPLIAVYDADTLDYTGEYYPISRAYLVDGHIPFCAVDRDAGYLYTAGFDDVDTLYAFKIDDMSFSHKINMTKTLQRVQGAEVYDGKVYVSTDPKDSSTEKVFTVDVKTGDTEFFFERTVSNFGNEAEGITVYPMADGSLIHVADYDELLGVNIRHYSVK